MTNCDEALSKINSVLKNECSNFEAILSKIVACCMDDSLPSEEVIDNINFALLTKTDYSSFSERERGIIEKITSILDRIYD